MSNHSGLAAAAAGPLFVDLLQASKIMAAKEGDINGAEEG